MLISIVFLLHTQVTLSSHFDQTLYTYGTTYLQKNVLRYLCLDTYSTTFYIM